MKRVGYRFSVIFAGWEFEEGPIPNDIAEIYKCLNLLEEMGVVTEYDYEYTYRDEQRDAASDIQPS